MADMYYLKAMLNLPKDKSDREINPDAPWDNYEPVETDLFLADRLNDTIIRVNEDVDGRFKQTGTPVNGDISADGNKGFTTNDRIIDGLYSDLGSRSSIYLFKRLNRWKYK